MRYFLRGKGITFFSSISETFLGQVKNSPGDAGSIPGLGRSLEKETASHFSILAGKSQGQRSLVGYNPWGRKDFNTTDHACNEDLG